MKPTFYLHFTSSSNQRLILKTDTTMIRVRSMQKIQLFKGSYNFSASTKSTVHTWTPVLMYTVSCTGLRTCPSSGIQISVLDLGRAQALQKSLFLHQFSYASQGHFKWRRERLCIPPYCDLTWYTRRSKRPRNTSVLVLISGYKILWCGPNSITVFGYCNDMSCFNGTHHVVYK